MTTEKMRVQRLDERKDNFLGEAWERFPSKCYLFSCICNPDSWRNSRDRILLAVTLKASRESAMVVISYLLDLSLVGWGAGSHVLFLFPFL